MEIDSSNMLFTQLNETVRNSTEDIVIKNCCGQRFIAAGLSNKNIDIYGTPGNALGAYLNGAIINVYGNAQDAVGDTMNAGSILVHGNIGDCVGYAMRGGKIYIKGDAGYRAGIHMKEYKEKKPILVIGGKAGSFLGEYQAGGIIICLGLNTDSNIIGDFPCTGMHGGKMLLRSNCKDIKFPKNIIIKQAKTEDLEEFKPYISEYCSIFGYDEKEILSSEFSIITPDSNNPYKQMYVMN